MNRFSEFNGWKVVDKNTGALAAEFQLTSSETVYVEGERDYCPLEQDVSRYNKDNLESVLKTGTWSDNDRALMEQALAGHPANDGQS